MTQVGDRLPEGQLVEFIETEGGKLSSKLFNVSDSVKGKKIAVVAVPTAFQPDYLKRVQAGREAGADEIWCIGPNDPFAAATWSSHLKEAGKIRMVADGSGVYSKALGLEVACSNAGGSARSSMLIDDGIVKRVNLQATDKFAASNDESNLARVA